MKKKESTVKDQTLPVENAKLTHYMSQDNADRLEDAWLEMKRTADKKIGLSAAIREKKQTMEDKRLEKGFTKSLLVESIIVAALDEYESKGEKSMLFKATINELKKKYID